MTIYFSEVFKRPRKNKDLTQEQMADILCVSPQAVSRWETGATYPDISLLPSVADFFDVSVDELLGASKAKAELKIEDYLKQFQEAINKNRMD